MHRIAKELGKFRWEVEQECPASEYMDWYYYFQLEIEESKNAQKKGNKSNTRKVPNQNAF